MKKPIIIAICGKSAAGKDSLRQFLWLNYCSTLMPARKMLSDTTRPKREKEVAGKDYNFITPAQFLENAENGYYLEYTEFRKWFYGTPKQQIIDGFNIGIFNPEGLKKISRYQRQYTIIPVYLDVERKVRFHRMIERENGFKIEFIRRLFVDWKDFRNIKALLQNRFKYSLVLSDAENILREVRDVSNYIIQLGLYR